MSMSRTTSPIELGRLGLGTSPLGNMYRFVDDDAATNVLEAAWEEGVRYFDSAPHYGLGLAEQRTGQYLSKKPRDEFVFSTKVGRILEPNGVINPGLDAEGFVVPASLSRRWDFSADGVERSLAASLHRTGLDRVDILYLHDPENHLEQAITQALPRLVSLRSSGVVRAIGIGSKDVKAMTRFVETGEIDLVMVAGRYTLLEQPAADALLPAAAAYNTQVVDVGVFNSGLLATSNPRASDHYEYGAVPEHILERARQLAEVCGRHDVELPHAAVQFALRNPAVINVTLGIGKPAHVASSARWASIPVPESLWDELTELRLIPSQVHSG
jgi:D-threo-aldose 1-dehydrogenase